MKFKLVPVWLSVSLRIASCMYEVFAHFLALFWLNSVKLFHVSLVDILGKKFQSHLNVQVSVVCVVLDFIV